MPLPAKMPNGTRVKHTDGRTGKTTAWKPNVGTAGAYTVMWDADASEQEVFRHQLDSLAGGASLAEYDNALHLVTQKLGGYSAKAEGQWLSGGKLVDSVLIVSKPGYLGPGVEMHAHASMGGSIRKAHVKSGNSYVRNVVQDGKVLGTATAEDRAWLAQIKIRNSLISSKQSFLDGKEKLPEIK